MNLTEVIEKVKANKAAFPKGLDTDIVEVKRYLALIDVEPQTEKFAKATSVVVAIADNIGCQGEEELTAAFDAAEETLKELRAACLKAVADLNR